MPTPDAAEDAERFASLHAATYPRVLEYALCRTSPEHAVELTSDVFVAAWLDFTRLPLGDSDATLHWLLQRVHPDDGEAGPDRADPEQLANLIEVEGPRSFERAMATPRRNRRLRAGVIGLVVLAFISAGLAASPFILRPSPPQGPSGQAVTLVRRLSGDWQCGPGVRVTLDTAGNWRTQGSAPLTAHGHYRIEGDRVEAGTSDGRTILGTVVSGGVRFDHASALLHSDGSAAVTVGQGRPLTCTRLSR